MIWYSYVIRKGIFMKKLRRQVLILFMCILSACCFAGIIINFKPLAVYADVRGTITASSLNVRSGAGTENKILQIAGKNVSLKKGTKVSVIKKKNDWYYISFPFSNTTAKGYVLGEYVKMKNASDIPSDTPIPPSGQAGKPQTTATLKSSSGYSLPATVTASRLNIRTKADKTSAQLTVKGKAVALTKDTKVTVIKEVIKGKEKWYQITFWQGKEKCQGYALSDYIKLTLKTNVKAAVNSSASVKIRTSAETTKPYLQVNKKTVALSNKTALTITKEVAVKEEKWYQVSFTYAKAKRTGYILAKDVIFTSQSTPVAEKPSVKPNDDTSDDDTPAKNEDGSDNDGVTDAKTGNVIGTNVLNVRAEAGTDKAQLLDADKKKVTLALNQKVTILSEIKAESTIWYQVSFVTNGKRLKGYVLSEYIKVNKTNTDTTENPDKTEKPDETEKPEDNIPPVTLSDTEFEAALTAQGFPESYKPYLRTLHNLHPYWQFEAFRTNLDWETVISKESKVGLNLITNTKNLAWKSMETGSYNWKTDKFVPFDGSTWVTASKDAVKYYMDPRNFLTESGIFQFESLNYKSAYQNEAGVESILKNTALSNTQYTYNDEATASPVTITYGKTFIDAAEQSKVSPYHLAVRVKQEVVTGAASLSSSVSGKVSGYEGYYNFYNIGATHSTAAGGSVANGLKFAMSGTTNTINNALYLIPWVNPYKAIVGGAKYIGSSYIQRGQETVYLQKFNLTPVSTYAHQYMANVEAGKAEAAKTFAAYKSMEELPVLFQIPVFLNMPETICAAPADSLNPNNWLSDLTINGYELTPTFDVSDSVGTIYSLIVPSSVEGVNVSASAVSSKATVSGTGYFPLVIGTNPLVIAVTAENGQTRQYTINIVRDASLQ